MFWSCEVTFLIKDVFYLQDTVEKKLSQMILDKKFSGEWKHSNVYIQNIVLLKMAAMCGCWQDIKYIIAVDISELTQLV